MPVHSGSWFGLPDFGITEKLAGFASNGQRTDLSQTLNPRNIPQAQASQPPAGPVYGPAKPAAATGGQVLGASTGGGGARPTAPSPYQAPQQQQQQDGSGTNLLDIIRGQFDQARNSISGLAPQIDESYNIAKGDIQHSIDDATTTANTQKENLGTQFGDILKNQLQTYQDLGRQRQGTFSSLGSLDSSQYGEQQFRADQDFANQRTTTDMEKTKSLKSVDDQFASYQKTATSELAKLGLQYQSGKQAISDALSQNNIQEASALQGALENITNRANEIQDNMRNWATQSALLKSQGVDVMGALRNINGDQYGSNVTNQLASARSFGNNLIPQLTGQVKGSGYIGQTDKEKQYLASLGMA